MVGVGEIVGVGVIVGEGDEVGIRVWVVVAEGERVWVASNGTVVRLAFTDRAPVEVVRVVSAGEACKAGWDGAT
jgi:hypothetical protein